MTSPGFKVNVNKLAPCEEPVILLELSHKDLSDDIRIAQSNEDIIHNGNTYHATDFNFKHFKDSDSENPTAQIVISNIGRDMMRFIHLTNGAQDTLVTYKVVRKTDPDTIELTSCSFIRRITATIEAITITLSFYNFFNRRAIKRIFDPEHSPGLF